MLLIISKQTREKNKQARQKTHQKKQTNNEKNNTKKNTQKKTSYALTKWNQLLVTENSFKLRIWLIYIYIFFFLSGF